MNFNIRSAIKANIIGNSQKDLEATIVDAISNGEEKMLPGLGYLFELIWQNSDDAQKNHMLSTLEGAVKH